MSMEATFNQSHPRVIRLRNQPQRFSFFQAARDVESVADGLPRLGHALSPSQEALRIQQAPNLDCAPAAIESAQFLSNGSLRLSQRFFGMLGPSGPLPLHYTELVRNRTRHAADPTIQEFLNLFHHRMALLFYRAWSSARPAIQRDRPWQDRYSAYVAALSGYGMNNAKHRDRWPDETKWFFTGRMAPLRRNAEGLEQMVSSTLGCPAQVKPFQLRRLTIDSTERSQLGIKSNTLGRSSLLGTRIPDRQSLVELRLGPMPYDLFGKLLTKSPRRNSLESLIKNFVSPGMTVRLRLVLHAKNAPKIQLGRSGNLGSNAWLLKRNSETDLDDCCGYIS